MIVMKEEEKIDLSNKEDMSIAVMNLLSAEEHLAFTGMKTRKSVYFDMVEGVREIRKQVLRGLVKKPEGEVWCASKHLLAAAIRLIETGEKLKHTDAKTSEKMFRNAFELYTLFWVLQEISGGGNSEAPRKTRTHKKPEKQNR